MSTQDFVADRLADQCEDGASLDLPTESEFAVTSVSQTAGGLLITICGTCLGAIESRACRSIVDQIALDRGWRIDGAQAEWTRSTGEQFSRLFLFRERNE